jgi:hypothetical protein
LVEHIELRRNEAKHILLAEGAKLLL